MVLDSSYNSPGNPGSNWGPLDLQSNALPTELFRLVEWCKKWTKRFWNMLLFWKEKKRISPNVGLEPTTPRLRVSCSTDWANRADILVFETCPFCFWVGVTKMKRGEKKIKAPPRFELGISCLLDRRFNQLSHGATLKYRIILMHLWKTPMIERGRSTQRWSTCRLVGLGVWFSLRVREVPGSNPGRAQFLFNKQKIKLRQKWIQHRVFPGGHPSKY